ncbi:MAG: hypothetical protein OXB93_04055 [Cytophagales bacterium]|nr:hypothetical protein [Cytophagales bacterium]
MSSVISPVVSIVYAQGGSTAGRIRDGVWSARFKKHLALLFKQVTGEDLKIHSISDDRTIQEEDLKKSESILCVLSGSYERAHPIHAPTHQLLEQLGEKNISLYGKHRFFKILREDINVGRLFPEHRYIPHYSFFDVDPITQEKRYFSHEGGIEMEQSYWLRLIDVVHDLSAIHGYLAHPNEEEAKRKFPINKTVYLAESGADTADSRRALRRELQRRGFRVLPERAFPPRPEAVEKMTQLDLQQSILSIHLIGRDYGRPLPGTNISIIELQNRVAHQHTLNTLRKRKKGEKKFYRFLWMDPENENLDQKQRAFVEIIQSEAATVEEAEVLEVEVPEFKSIVLGKLSALQNTEEQEKQKEIKKDKMGIYLMYDGRDRNDIDQIASLLIDEGFHVLTLPPEGEPWELRKTHQQHLRECDGAIIYLNKATPQWLNTKLQDILKAPAFGRNSDIPAKAALLRSNSPVYKKLGESITVVRYPKGKETISSEILNPFLEQMKLQSHG